MTHACGEIPRQRTMLIGKIRDWPGELRVPLRPRLGFQKPIGRPQSRDFRLLQNLDRLSLHLRVDLAVRRPPPQPMHRYGVSLRLHPLQRLANPALTDAHPLPRLPLRHLPVAGSLYPVQPAPFLFGSSQFVPSFRLAAVNRNFLLGPIRNVSLGRDRMM